MRLDDECDSSDGIELIISAYQRLKDLKPTNYLLSMVKIHPDNKGFDTTDEFHKTYFYDLDSIMLQGLVRYVLEIEKAIIEKTDTIVLSRRDKTQLLKNITKTKRTQEYWNRFFEDQKLT